MPNGSPPPSSELVSGARASGAAVADNAQEGSLDVAVKRNIDDFNSFFDWSIDDSPMPDQHQFQRLPRLQPRLVLQALVQSQPHLHSSNSPRQFLSPARSSTHPQPHPEEQVHCLTHQWPLTVLRLLRPTCHPFLRAPVPQACQLPLAPTTMQTYSFLMPSPLVLLPLKKLPLPLSPRSPQLLRVHCNSSNHKSNHKRKL